MGPFPRGPKTAAWGALTRESQKNRGASLGAARHTAIRPRWLLPHESSDRGTKKLPEPVQKSWSPRPQLGSIQVLTRATRRDYSGAMTQHLELDWIDGGTAHVTNRTGAPAHDVVLRVRGLATVGGEPGWEFTADALYDGEFIALDHIEVADGRRTDPPQLEMNWRSEDPPQSHSRQVALVAPATPPHK